MKQLRLAPILILTLGWLAPVLTSQAYASNPSPATAPPAPLVHAYDPTTTKAVCQDWTASAGADPATACAGHGGVLDWFGSASPAPGRLLDASPAGTLVSAVPVLTGPLSVQSPSSSVSSRTAPSPVLESALPPPPPAVGTSTGNDSSSLAGPIFVAASLNTATCQGGPVQLSVNVSDANGSGVPGAMVTGNVQYQSGGGALSFPPTDASGNTSTSVDTGQSSGGYNVVFTVDAAAAGTMAETQATCFAP
jgi:hypothetical protein